MDDALGAAGRARRIHPERHFVAMGVGFRQFGREIRQPRLGDDRVRHGVVAGRAIDHDQRVQRGVLAGDRIEARAKLGVGDRDSGAGIRQIELQQVRRRQRVDQKRHEPGAHRAEKRRRIGRGVVEEHQDAVAALQAPAIASRGPSARLPRKVRHSCGCRAGRSAPSDRRCLGQIVEQDAAGVVEVRNRKADLARARTIARAPDRRSRCVMTCSALCFDAS